MSVAFTNPVQDGTWPCQDIEWAQLQCAVSNVAHVLPFGKPISTKCQEKRGDFTCCHHGRMAEMGSGAVAAVMHGDRPFPSACGHRGCFVCFCHHPCVSQARKLPNRADVQATMDAG